MISVLLVIAVTGAALTMALAFAQSNSLTNTFKAAEHSTEITEDVTGLDKNVTVTNNSKESAAFVRVRLVVSPENAQEEIKLVFDGEAEGNGRYVVPKEWAEADDGFYYYLSAVPAGESTTRLLDAVDVAENYKEPFDVTVYEESCVASTTGTVTLEQIQQAFAQASGDQ